MPNLHTPERQPDETQKRYRERQALSLAAVVSLRFQKPLTGFKQHRNPRANARRAAKAEIGARQYRMQRKALRRAAMESA